MIGSSIVASTPVGVTITSGRLVSEPEPQQFCVPKVDLVSCVQLALSRRILRIAEDLPEASLLQNELALFEVKLTPAAHETFGVWREGAHDDMVLSLAIGLWFGMKIRLPGDCGITF